MISTADERATHWNGVYRTKRHDEVSWYRPHLDTSLALIEACGLPPDAPILDVGGGESTLVDDLLDRGHTDVTVLDVAETALAHTRARLGERVGAHSLHWIVGDVTTVALPEARYALWHDRAVFHFLTDPAQRAAYVRQAARSVGVGGHVIVGTFGPDGPLQCSGLEVVRYQPAELHEQFGPRFVLERHVEEVHRTPLGRSQQFVWCYCRLVP